MEGEDFEAVRRRRMTWTFVGVAGGRRRRRRRRRRVGTDEVPAAQGTAATTTAGVARTRDDRGHERIGIRGMLAAIIAAITVTFRGITTAATSTKAAATTASRECGILDVPIIRQERERARLLLRIRIRIRIRIRRHRGSPSLPSRLRRRRRRLLPTRRRGPGGSPSACSPWPRCDG